MKTKARRYVSMHDLRRLRALVQHLRLEIEYRERNARQAPPVRFLGDIVRDANALARVLDTVCAIGLQC